MNIAAHIDFSARELKQWKKTNKLTVDLNNSIHILSISSCFKI